MMLNLRSIVVPVDFGEASARAVTVAGLLGRACGATLILMHAESLDLPPYFTAAQADAFEQERRAARLQANAYLQSFGRQHTDQPFSTEIVDGPPVDAIIAAAAVHDLVVMGTHGRRGVSRWWLGSVAERVVRESSRPVLVVHEQSALDERDPLVVIGSEEGPGDAGERLAGQDLATCLKGRWSVVPVDDVATAAQAGGAGLVVVRKPWPGGRASAVQRAERLLLTCTRPVLFVPA